MRTRTVLLLATIALPLFASAQEEEKFPWEEDASPTPEAVASPTPSASPSPSPSPSPTPRPALTKEDVIAMSKAKIGETVIIKKIQTSGVVFALEVDDLVALKKAGVSGKVIEAMVATEQQLPPEPTPTPKPTPDERLDDLAEPTNEPTATPTEEPDPFSLSGTPTPAPTPTVNPVWLPDGATPVPEPEPTPWGRRPVLRGTYDDGLAAGMMEAEEVPTTEWAALGFGGGFCFGMIGCGAATAGGQVVDIPKKRPEKLDETAASEEYRDGYQRGFKAKLKNKRSTAAFLGGAAGQGTCIAAYVAIVAIAAISAANQQDDETAVFAIRF